MDRIPMYTMKCLVRSNVNHVLVDLRLVSQWLLATQPLTLQIDGGIAPAAKGKSSFTLPNQVRGVSETLRHTRRTMKEVDQT